MKKLSWIIIIFVLIGFTTIACDLTDNETNTTNTCAQDGHDWNWVITSQGVETATGTCKRRGCNAVASGEIRFLYNLGDTGPGGGKIFYIADGKSGRTFGFRLYLTANDTVGTIVYYLEAAPFDFPDLTWASSEFINTNISGTEEEIGKGKRNTALILAVDPMAPAAKACNDYINNGLSDWFLPSLRELFRLDKDLISNPSTSYYWSSTQSNNINNWPFRFILGHWNATADSKNSTNSVRAIRAF